MKIIITGGAGFIGCNIARELARRRHKIKIIDNLSTGKLKNIADIKNKVKFIKGDIKNLAFLKKEFKGFDYVLHHAAMRAVAKTVDNPIECNGNNITGTLNVLEAARDVKIKRVVFASSSAIYGSVKSGKNHESLPPNPLSPYALTKLTGEYYCRLFWQLYGLPTICLRYFNVYGPYQNPESKY
ncbi:MAG: NAD-dependent epimerase/dehydratase family protein, partial [Patescibacteria group bacterium]